jgi:predicted metalloprotease with PDZ domain
MFAVLIFSSLVGAAGAKVGDVPPNGRARQRSDNVPRPTESILNRPFLVAAVLGFLAGIAASSARAEVPAPRAEDYAPGTLKINVDATDVAHRIFSVHESIPTVPGPLTLLYPQWIPGTHGPSGPIDRLAGLTIRANGQVLPWRRDPLDVFAFHVDVPPAAHELEVAFQFLSPLDKSQGRVVMTPELLDLQWNTVSLYPAGYYANRIRAEASVTYPAGWQSATALEVASHSGNTVTYQPIDYDDLVDSPIYAGSNFKRIDLDPRAPIPMHLDIVADEPQSLQIAPQLLKAYQKLVQQMYRLYGARHFDHYDFLLALSNKMSGIGLEHHRSSENGVDADYFSKWSDGPARHDLLSHEFNHSWDGKYRRAADQNTPNFNVPLQGSLLWVYEGQTQFWGYVMAARAGLWSPEEARDMFASAAAMFDEGRPGLAAWRTVQDTTNDPVLARRGGAFRSYQASFDYYPAGMMIWLDVDAKLRELSRNQRGIDDFCQAFFGMQDGKYDVNPYTFEDIVTTLNAVAPYDWARYLRTRLDGHGSLTGGIPAHGWQLVYTDKPSTAFNSSKGATDVTYSLGALLGKDGEVTDVLWDGPAFKAGLAPGMKVLAVNGREFSGDALKEAITAAKGTSAPVQLLVKNFDEYRTLSVACHEGLRYPHLVRTAAPDSLSELLAARK